MEGLYQQYSFVKDTRQVLFQYCSTISQDHFIKDAEAFGNRSIKYLFVHVANTYKFWIGRFAGTRHEPFAESETLSNVKEIEFMFATVDEMVDQFLVKNKDQLSIPVINKVPGYDVQLLASPFKLFTHVITHEFHHKGQILSISRQLGYVPVDTDIIRF